MASPLGMRYAEDWVLEFLNTVVWRDGRLVDRFQTDEDAIEWLRKVGLVKTVDAGEAALLEGLASEARLLRRDIGDLLFQRQSGETVDIERLNRVLGNGKYRMELIEDEAGQLHAVRTFAAESAQQVLGPVALAAADVLVSDAFRVIRKCEGEGCLVWFHDRTKSRRRRWCDMALCGNRQKVSRFRARVQTD